VQRRLLGADGTDQVSDGGTGQRRPVVEGDDTSALGLHLVEPLPGAVHGGAERLDEDVHVADVMTVREEDVGQSSVLLEPAEPAGRRDRVQRGP
jgi:hypothetical protein